jgi:hypothetical protein
VAVARRPFARARRRQLSAWARRHRLFIRIQQHQPLVRPQRSGSFVWARRGVLAATLLAVALVPYPVAGSAAFPSAGACRGPCQRSGPAGRLVWASALPGQWTASSGLSGTVPVHGQAYAAVADGVAAVGVGTKLRAYNARTGETLWNVGLPGFPADASIVSVRVWPGIITAGVAYGPAAAARAEVVFDSSTGHQIRWYNAAPFGGAVAGSLRTTVIVGASAVTAYDNQTGAVRWTRPTGPAAQAWQADGADLYVTEAADGYLGPAPVTALRRIDLSDGLETIVRPSAAAFPGSLAGAVDEVVLFSQASGVTAYDGLTGLRLWSLPGSVPEGTDPGQQRFYVTEGTTLVGVDPLTGRITARASGSAVAGSAGMFAVWNGVALGLDQGPNGEAWGYDVGLQRVIWASPALPWPHYFVDLSGIGGSADPAGATVVVAGCAKLARASPPIPGASGAAGSSAPGSSQSASPATGSAGTSSAGPASSASPSTTAAPPGRLCQSPQLIAIDR